MSTLDDLTTGEPKSDRLHRMLYAQDASVYEEEPLGVVFPRSRKEVERIVEFADTARVPLIPRGGGTSLAGQCVGEGLVVDLGRHMNRILEVNAEERWVRVEPGVILDDLNRHLADYDLFFGPDTSTSNRCMIGGMIGNNSCGSHSIYYGTTRDHVLEVGVVLADGSFEVLGPKERDEWIEREGRGDLLGRAMHTLREVVESNAELIDEHYPRPDVVRRNTGYALDIVSNTQLGGQEGAASLASLICGSEGTLGLVTEAKLNLVDRPCENILVCAHFERLREALEATIDAVEHEPAAVELMDRPILELTKGNREQRKNRFFVEGDPEAILVVEFYGDDADEVEHKARRLIEEFKKRGRGYAHPIVRPPDDGRVWALRKAGLGLLMGLKGDTKPVTVVEDTAVAVDALPDYIDDFADIMDAHGTRCVYYAHASVGELHLRPELNLKDAADAERFKAIAAEVVDLVKHYGGSLSGEHGDGRLRSPLLEQFYGADIMALHRRVKEAFDPHGIFNPRKIVDPEPIDVDWRYGPDKPTPDVGQTVLDWSDDGGLVRAVEKCNGAGVCRKRAEAGGTMCPSYMATLDEKDSTRGRANVFRQALYSPDPRRAFRNEELREALDLCLSCKACKTECPANVDMARMKAEFTQQYHDKKGTPLSALLFGHYRKLSRLGSILPALT
ncbi:MAG: FAD-binding and (Fe-S)-binding domain-containing protein, partial [Persicimonas sp.]